jgi:signal transduction histidine kinase
MLAFAAGLLITLGVLVRGTIERVNQINRVSSEVVLTAADAVAGAIADEVQSGDWTALQARLRAMASQHLRLRYRVATLDGRVVGDSQLIRATGRLDLPLAARALAEGRTLAAAGDQPYQLTAAMPLLGAGSHPAAVLVADASWERQYLEQRSAIERESLAAALVLLIVVTGAFITVWLVGAQPLHRLRVLADAAAAGRVEPRPPSFRLTDLHAIGRAIHHLAEHNQRLVAEREALHQEIEALEQAREDADTANAAKSDFLARMSHDLRTPLHGIIGFSEMIRDQLFGPVGVARYVDYARDIHQSGVHLLRLINDVLDLSKIEAGRFELADDTVSVATVIAEAVQAVSPLAESRGLAVAVVPMPSLPVLTADEKTVRQMLFNLLSNAIKFTDSGGSVTISAQAGAEGLDITIADTGTGIDTADLDRVFSGYSQGGPPRSRPAEGTGLGLVIVKSLIELHGGRLTLTSTPGRGTIVTLTFPPGRVGQGG